MSRVPPTGSSTAISFQAPAKLSPRGRFRRARSIDPSASSFSELGVSEHATGVLVQRGIDAPTPIQRALVTSVAGGSYPDVWVRGPTGKGLPEAYGLTLAPVLEGAARARHSGSPVALMLTPHVSTAMALAATVAELTQRVGARIDAPKKRNSDLDDPHLLVMTPSRLLELYDARQISLDDVCLLLMHNADEYSASPLLQRLMEALPGGEELQKVAVAAERPTAARLKDYLVSPRVIRLGDAP